MLKRVMNSDYRTYRNRQIKKKKRNVESGSYDGVGLYHIQKQLYPVKLIRNWSPVGLRRSPWALVDPRIFCINVL